MKLGIVMEPIATIDVLKNSSFAILLAAQARGWELYYMGPDDLFLNDGVPGARVRRIGVQDSAQDWYEFHNDSVLSLTELDVILMRVDPPIDMEYLYITYLLELAQQRGTLVVNAPAALRDSNEKLFTAWFPQCTAPTLIASKNEQLRDFLNQHRDIILKPLNLMGGASIFRVQVGDANANVIFEMLTNKGRTHVMAQSFIEEIFDGGDKRILLIDGEPLPYALARFPKAGDIRGNLAAGGTARGAELSDRDRWLCTQLTPELKKRELLFVGIDVIGDYLTEINVTSPTCIRELDRLYDLDIAGALMETIAVKLAHQR